MYAHQKGLLDLMTLVNDRVSRQETPENRVQMPCIVSCLTRKKTFSPLLTDHKTDKTFVLGGVHFKRKEDKFVEAIVDQFERDLLDKIIKSATYSMLRTDPATVQKTVNTWRN